jgi:hypothetical protein
MLTVIQHNSLGLYFIVDHRKAVVKNIGALILTMLLVWKLNAMVEPKTNLRTAADKQATIKAVAEYLTPMIEQALRAATKTCMTCDHFRQVDEICQKYNMRPPAKVIAFGCPAYEDEIPF